MKATTTTRTKARAPRSRGGKNIGRRVRVGPISHYMKAAAGKEGVLVEKTSDPAWPFIIVLDSGEELSLDDWQFEFIGSETVPVLPVRSIPKTDLVKVESEVMAKVASKTRREPVKTKGKVERVAPTTRREATPKATKAAARSTAREGGKKHAKWNDIILKALDGSRKMALAAIYAVARKARPDVEEVILQSTVRRTLQAMAKENPPRTKWVEAGIWGVAGKAAKA